MKASQAAIDLIKEFEGLSLSPYNCPAGHATIGWGHMIHTGAVTDKDKERYRGFDRDDADALLQGDVRWMENDLRRRLPDWLTQWQYDAMVSLYYNCPSALLSTTGLSKALQAHDAASAGREILRWCYAAGKKLPGLQRRRAAEKKLFDGPGAA
jgi:lysozyme